MYKIVSRRCIFLLLIIFFSGCTILPSKPNLPRIYNQPASPRPTKKNPIIVIPGVLGSRLVNRKTNEVAWPKFTGTNSQQLALPITSTNFAENQDDLVATEIIDRARFFQLAPEIGFYDSLLTALEQGGGYRHGNFENPPSDGDHDIYYVFAYDWRRDNVESARLLMQKISKLKQQLNRPDLQFDVVAHSMGGLIARYVAMYGDHDVMQDDEPRPNWSGAQHIARLIMFGTPNSGSMDALSTLINGYSVLGTNLPRLKLLDALDRDAIFTTPSAYQLLPHCGYSRFYDGKLNSLSVDLFDVETWRKYRWSIAFDDGFKLREQKRYQKEHKKLSKQKSAEAETKLGEMEEATARIMAAREPFLRIALMRAAKFQRALDVQSQPPSLTRFYLFGGDCTPTLEAAVITATSNIYSTFFRVNRAIGPRALRNRAESLMYVPGDGRVTRHSLFGLQFIANETVMSSPLPVAQQTIFHCESHGDLPLNATLQDNLLAVLLGNSY